MHVVTLGGSGTAGHSGSQITSAPSQRSPWHVADAAP